MLKFRSIGLSDFAVLEGSNRIGRIRLATERMPRVWLWSVTLPLPGDLPTGSSKDLDTARGQVQGGMEKLEGPDHARATDSSLRGDEVRDDE